MINEWMNECIRWILILSHGSSYINMVWLVGCIRLSMVSTDELSLLTCYIKGALILGILHGYTASLTHPMKVYTLRNDQFHSGGDRRYLVSPLTKLVIVHSVKNCM